MIVVAIIGILAAIAIPNFLRFQCKSKQSEVKAGLGGLWTAEKTFLAEHNTYSTDLVNVNWEPDGAPLYIYGFTTAYPSVLPEISGYNPANNNTRVSAVVGSPARYQTSRMVDLTNALLQGPDLPANDVTGQDFVLGAAADISPDPATRLLDQWQMFGANRMMYNIANDCAQ